MDNKKVYSRPLVDLDSLDGEELMLTISVNGDTLDYGGNSSEITPGDDGLIHANSKIMNNGLWEDED